MTKLVNHPMINNPIFHLFFTAFIVVMIVAPIPPSTIVGIALATNAKTGQLMHQPTYRAIMWLMNGIGTGTHAAIKRTLAGREKAITSKIARGNINTHSIR